MKTLYQVRYSIKSSKNNMHNVVADSPSEAIELVEANMHPGSMEHTVLERAKEEHSLHVIAIARVDIV